MGSIKQMLHGRLGQPIVFFVAGQPVFVGDNPGEVKQTYGGDFSVYDRVHTLSAQGICTCGVLTSKTVYYTPANTEEIKLLV